MNNLFKTTRQIEADKSLQNAIKVSKYLNRKSKRSQKSLSKSESKN